MKRETPSDSLNGKEDRMAMYNMKTKNDYDFFEAASSLQKEIRRGKEAEALFWAIELGESYSDFLWARLTIISNEDIGLASPETIMLVEALRQQFDFIRKKKGTGWRIILGTAILAMCRAKKTRLSDNFICAITHRRDSENWKLDPPDYALDQHTQRGRAMGRGFDFWKNEGCKVENEAEGMDIYGEEAWEMRAKHGKISREPAANPVRGKNAPLLFGTEEE
jgi:replication-associated recombination protein RarA